MEKNSQQELSDLSFINRQQLSGYHVKDILFLMLRNLHWILLCAAVGAFLSYLFSSRQERIYESNAKILIRSGAGLNINDDDAREGVIKNALGMSSFYSSSINNEIMILTSKTTILKAVEDLHLNINYTTKTRLTRRTKDLYGISPVIVDFNDADRQTQGSFVVRIASQDSVEILQNDFPAIAAAFDNPVITPLGSITVHRTWNYTPSDNGKEITVNLRNAQAIADQYRHALTVIRDDEKNSIVNISINDISALRAADFINAVIRAYNEGAINDKKRIISETYNYINERLSVLSHDLGAQEYALASYRSQNEIIGTGEMGQSYMNVSLQSSEEASRLQNELTMARYLQQAVADNNGSQTISSGAILNDAGIMATVARFNENALRIQEYRSSGITNNPVATSTVAEQKRIQNQLVAQVNTYISTLEHRVGTARSSAINANAKMRQVPQKQVQLEGMERNQKIKEELYVTLLTRREELMISQPSIEGSAKVIDEARVNNKPVAPNTPRATLIGLILGLLVPLIYYLLSRMLDTRVKNYSDVENVATNIPFLSELPELKEPSEGLIVVFENREDEISEAFRMLRTKVEFLVDHHKGQAKTILVTSLIPASGKSFISANLAASIAISDKKVLLVDLDLRKGTLTKRFASRNTPGLVHYLTDKVNGIDQLVQHNVIAEGVDAIFSGPHPPNPAELLGTGKLDTLMEQLRTMYDYIIFDCPPAGIVVDIDIIKHLADHSLFVIRANKTDKRLLIDLDRLHREDSFPNMVIVLNAVNHVNRMYGNKYGYGYGYGYNYGYGYGYGYGYSYGSAEGTATTEATATPHPDNKNTVKGYADRIAGTVATEAKRVSKDIKRKLNKK